MAAGSEDEEDILLRDRKQQHMSGWNAVLPFAVSVCIVLPLWLALLLPLAVLWQLLSWPCRTLCAAAPRGNAPGSAAEPRAHADKKSPDCLDVVVFGATGFTGQLVAHYLAENYGTKIKWGIAGRRQDALATLRSELAAVDPGLSDLPIFIADSKQPSSLYAMVSGTRVIVSTVGPFALYGTPLVEACATTGTHYCDITGESDWVREMIDRFDDCAAETGARIVHFCGHDCVPWCALCQISQCLARG